MLEMKAVCERCGTKLPPDTDAAYICSYECTFCRDCRDGALERQCPNCRGELLLRPRRAPAR